MKKIEFVIGANWDGTPLIHTMWIPIKSVKYHQ